MNWLLKSLFCALVSAFLLWINVVFAADITIESYIEGGVTLALNGDWTSGINFGNLAVPGSDTTLFWEGDQNTDYISFVDDTSTDGFYVTFSMTDFVYSGSSQSQVDIPAANMTIIPEYVSGSAAAITKGDEDPTKNLSLLDESCGNADIGDYDFHADFSDVNKDYSLVGSTSTVNIIEGDVDCLNMGLIRFDRVEALVPAGSAAGSYTTTLTFTIIDGFPT